MSNVLEINLKREKIKKLKPPRRETTQQGVSLRVQMNVRPTKFQEISSCVRE